MAITLAMVMGMEMVMLIYVSKYTVMRYMNRVIDVTKFPLTLILIKSTNDSVKHEVKKKMTKGSILYKVPKFRDLVQ